MDKNRHPRTIAAAVLLLTLLCASQSGGDFDTVILATTRNYPDAIVAGAGADKAGIPVILTPADELPQEVAQFLKESRPQKVIIVGGPAVISKDIEEGLTGDGFDVHRLWGVTQYGTAAEFATYIWPEGSAEAVIVYDVLGDGEGFEHIQLAMAKGLAAAKKIPVILTSGDSLSAEAGDALETLGAEKAFLVGNEFSDNVTEELKGLGIDVETVTGSDVKDIGRKLEDMTMKELGSERAAIDSLVVVATSETDFVSSISLPTAAESVVHKVISDESEVVDVVEFVKENGIKSVKVVGLPALVSKVAAQLLLIEGIEVEALSTTNVEKKLVDLVERTKSKWNEKRITELKSSQERLLEKRAELAERVKAELEKARAMLDETEQSLLALQEEAVGEDQLARVEDAAGTLEDARGSLEEAGAAFEEAEGTRSVDGYVRALSLIKKAYNMAKTARWDGVNDFYGADEGRKREAVEGYLAEESGGMDSLMEDFESELEKFKDFYARAEDAGLLATDCGVLVDEAEQLLAKGMDAFDARRYSEARGITLRVKKNLQKCVVLTMQQNKGDEEGLKNFRDELEGKRKKDDFEQRIKMCSERCAQAMDSCMGRLRGCADGCKRVEKGCQEGARKMKDRCSSLTGASFGAVLDRCIKGCDASQDGSKDECYLQCKEMDDHARDSINKCVEEVESYVSSCAGEAAACADRCAGSGEDECRGQLKACVPDCVGERFFTDPRFAGEACHIKCEAEPSEDRDACHSTCEGELIARGEYDSAKRECLKEADSVRSLCMGTCMDECGSQGETVSEEVCHAEKECEEAADAAGERVCTIRKVCETKTRQSLERCKVGCDQSCRRKADEFVYSCSQERSDNLMGGDDVKKCQDACASKSGRDRYDCIEVCLGERRESGDKAKRLMDYCLKAKCADSSDKERNLCVAKCMGRESEDASEAGAKKCRSDRDCGDTICPMVIGQDTPRCIDGACRCGPGEKLLAGIGQPQQQAKDPKRACEEKCRLERKDVGMCMDACLKRSGQVLQPGVELPKPMPSFDPCQACRDKCKAAKLADDQCKKRCDEICRVQTGQGGCGDGVCDYSVGEDCGRCKGDCPCDLAELPVCDVGHPEADERGCRPASEGVAVARPDSWKTSPCQQQGGQCVHWRKGCPSGMAQVEAPCQASGDVCCMPQRQDKKACGDVPGTFCIDFQDRCPAGTFGMNMPCRSRSEQCCAKPVEQPPRTDPVGTCVENECRQAPATDAERCKLKCGCLVKCSGDFSCVEGCMGFSVDDKLKQCVAGCGGDERCARKCKCHFECQGEYQCVEKCLGISQGDVVAQCIERNCRWAYGMEADRCKRKCECDAKCRGEPTCMGQCIGIGTGPACASSDECVCDGALGCVPRQRLIDLSKTGSITPGNFDCDPTHVKCLCEGGACVARRVEPPKPTVGMENPASRYCIENGGWLEIKTDSTGGQFGVCVFPDGSHCEEWAFYKGECRPGGQPPRCGSNADCPAGAECVGGQCQPSGGQKCPDGICDDFERSNPGTCCLDCGCPVGHACVEGQCRPVQTVTPRPTVLPTVVPTALPSIAPRYCGDGLCDETERSKPGACCKDCCASGTNCIDASCLGTTTPVCGDGRCDASSESHLTCCKDCKCPEGSLCNLDLKKCVAVATPAPTAVAPTPTAQPMCGDQRCEGAETMATCCKDCGCPSGHACVENQCRPKPCTGNADCACKGGCGCILAAIEPMNCPTVISECQADKAVCVCTSAGTCAASPVPTPAPTVAQPVCGDQRCEGAETMATCCKDCGCPSGHQCVENQCKPIATPVPTAQPAVCGDQRCDGGAGETMATCCKDCGCPTVIPHVCTDSGCKPQDTCQACKLRCVEAGLTDCAARCSCKTNPNACPCDIPDRPICLGAGMPGADDRGCAPRSDNTAGATIG